MLHTFFFQAPICISLCSAFEKSSLTALPQPQPGAFLPNQRHPSRTHLPLTPSLPYERPPCSARNPLTSLPSSTRASTPSEDSSSQATSNGPDSEGRRSTSASRSSADTCPVQGRPGHLRSKSFVRSFSPAVRGGVDLRARPRGPVLSTGLTSAMLPARATPSPTVSQSSALPFCPGWLPRRFPFRPGSWR